MYSVLGQEFMNEIINIQISFSLPYHILKAIGALGDLHIMQYSSTYFVLKNKVGRHKSNFQYVESYTVKNIFSFLHFYKIIKNVMPEQGLEPWTVRLKA